MKKINIWVVLLLNIVTLGIYTLFWTLSRRREMIAHYRQSIPSAGWFVCATAIFYASIVLTWWGSSVAGDLQAIIGLITLPVIIFGFVVAIWWVWQFGKAAASVASIPAGWSLALYITTIIFMSVFLQYYFNHTSQTHKSTQPKTSLTFKLLAILVIFVSAGTSLWYTIATFPTDTIRQEINKQKQMNSYQQQAYQLSQEHQACVQNLEQNYKEVTGDNQDAYQQAYDKCETIRKEQNAAVDHYNELLNRR